jgi:hypothetical protein
MTEEEKLRNRILDELLKRWPDHNPKIAEVHENTFTYELEKHGNYTYFVVGYSIMSSGELKIDWGSAQLTML